jgi:hypothetical protein
LASVRVRCSAVCAKPSCSRQASCSERSARSSLSASCLSLTVACAVILPLLWVLLAASGLLPEPAVAFAVAALFALLAVPGLAAANGGGGTPPPPPLCPAFSRACTPPVERARCSARQP